MHLGNYCLGISIVLVSALAGNVHAQTLESDTASDSKGFPVEERFSIPETFGLPSSSTPLENRLLRTNLELACLKPSVDSVLPTSQCKIIRYAEEDGSILIAGTPDALQRLELLEDSFPGLIVEPLPLNPETMIGLQNHPVTNDGIGIHLEFRGL